jgi:hypothetical protein
MWVFVSLADYLFDAGGWEESTQRGERRRNVPILNGFRISVIAHVLGRARVHNLRGKSLLEEAGASAPEESLLIFPQPV